VFEPSKNLKKSLLAGFVVLTFVAYSFHQRHDGSGVALVLPPIQTPTSTPPSTSINSEGADDGGTVTPPAATTTPQQTTGQYKNGNYTGSAANAYYGYIQVQAVIQGGKLTDVQILQYPSDRSTSVYINGQALPYLKQEAIQAQSSNVNIISGASDTSQAFIESLASALSQAH